MRRCMESGRYCIPWRLLADIIRLLCVPCGQKPKTTEDTEEHRVQEPCRAHPNRGSATAMMSPYEAKTNVPACGWRPVHCCCICRQVRSCPTNEREGFAMRRSSGDQRSRRLPCEGKRSV